MDAVLLPVPGRNKDFDCSLLLGCFLFNAHSHSDESNMENKTFLRPALSEQTHRKLSLNSLVLVQLLDSSQSVSLSLSLYFSRVSEINVSNQNHPDPA